MLVNFQTTATGLGDKIRRREDPDIQWASFSDLSRPPSVVCHCVPSPLLPSDIPGNSWPKLCHLWSDRTQMNWKVEMRDKNKLISDTATYHDFILTLTVPFSRQTAVTTHLSTELNHWTWTRHRIHLLPRRHENCIFLFILSEGQKSLWLGIMFRRIFVSSATSSINLFFSAKFPNLINHENMEVSNFFIFGEILFSSNFLR